MRMSKKWFTFVGIVLLVVLSACGHARKPDALNWKVQPFSFTDENGQRFGSKQLKGKVWIADFEFTHCTTVCPFLTANLAKLQKQLKEAHVPVQIVTFTVDPDRDTPEVLKKFGASYHADFSNWHFLTGYSFDELKDLSEQSFKSAVAKPEKGSDQFTHGVSFFLVDQNGVIVQKYEGYQNTPFKQIVADAKALNQ
ncbi:SCO family protein [Camelliibacillus cellulosilyticus]|uniref:SCO family protein n=1 Tax=Camelliibacillus cellulosilyticus TaxID=2174486 RepID=A0ABV9GLP5_9BACL